MEGCLQKGKKKNKRVREAARFSCKDMGCQLPRRKRDVLILKICVKTALHCLLLSLFIIWQWWDLLPAATTFGVCLCYLSKCCCWRVRATTWCHVPPGLVEDQITSLLPCPNFAIGDSVKKNSYTTLCPSSNSLPTIPDRQEEIIIPCRGYWI